MSELPLRSLVAVSGQDVKILVLGATGMLGSMVYKYFKHGYDCKVIGTSRTPTDDLVSFDVRRGLDTLPVDFGEIDYVINCIGITKPYCHDDNPEEVENAIFVNALFPYLLAKRAEEKGCKVIQIATDCVFSGTRENYPESDPHDPTDVYGKTKSLGEVRSKAFLNIRCSIIGPELNRKTFLMEWFLTQPDGAAVQGYTNHIWNGVTTLQFAELCGEIIRAKAFDGLRRESHVFHFAPNQPLTKYELLELFKKVWYKNVNVERAEDPHGSITRVLHTKYEGLKKLFPQGIAMEEALEHLFQFTRK